VEKGLDGLMALGGFGVKSREEVEVVLKNWELIRQAPLLKKIKRKAR
jgi:hypothetical protein